MGSSVSITSAGGAVPIAPDELFAFQVSSQCYDRMKYFQSNNEDAIFTSDDFSTLTDDIKLYSLLESIFQQAKAEFESPFAECNHPCVIITKYNVMSEIEKIEYNQGIEKAITEREKKLARIKNLPKADYSKSFGGTADDTKNEREAAELLRGAAANNVVDDVHINLRIPSVTTKFDYIAMKAAGKWIKYLGAGGCYMYIHNLTREVLSVRPEGFDDEAIAVSNCTDAFDATKDPANGLPAVELADLLVEVERVITELKKTPLILDCSPEQNVRTFFSYKAQLEDVSNLVIPFAKSGVRRNDVVERCRKKLVCAMKTGSTFALYLGSCSIEHADWKKKLCKKDTFPAETFVNAGEKLLRPDYEPRYKAIYREDDLEQGQAIVRDGFRTIVISSLDPYEYEELLADSIPLGYCQAIFVNN